MTNGPLGNAPDYSWQQAALTMWQSNACRGIIEAVTGSGKTHVAIQALDQLIRNDPLLSTLIIVPTIPLLEQWYEKLQQHFPTKKIGRIGGPHDDYFAVPPLAYVSTIQSALRKADDRFDYCWNPTNIGRYRSFLIADECHHYLDAEVWSKITKQYEWTYRMGLSATIDPFHVEGFGKIVYQYTFRDAFRHGLVPSFDLLNVGVPLTESESAEYFELSGRIGKQCQLVREAYTVPDEWFFKHLQRLMGKIGSKKEPEIERLFLLLFKRAAICYMAEHKMDLAERMTRVMVDCGKKIIVFFERIAAADLVNEAVAFHAGMAVQKRIQAKSSMWCKVYHSGMNANERATVLNQFRQQGPSALIVCRSLDEGLDTSCYQKGTFLTMTMYAGHQRRP